MVDTKDAVPPWWLVLCGPIFLNIGFGLYPVIVKGFASEGQEKADPFVFTFYRDAGAVPVLFICSRLIEGEVPVPSLRMTLVFMVFGLFGMFLGQYAYIFGLYMVGPDVSSALQPLISVWTVATSIILCTEKVPSPLMLHTWTKFAGIAAAVAGAAKLVLSGSTSADPTPTDSGDIQNMLASDNASLPVSSSPTELHISYRALGYCSLILDTVAAALYYTLQKKIVHNQPNCIWRDYPIATTGYAYLFGALFMGASTLYYPFTGQFQLFLIPSHSLFALLYAIFITSVFCYCLITWSNKYLPSSVMTAFWPMQVLVTVVTAYLVFGDKLTPGQTFGAFLVLVGLVLVVYSNHVEEQLQAGTGSAIRIDKFLCERKNVSTSIYSPLGPKQRIF